MKNCLLTLLAFGTAFASAQATMPTAPQQDADPQPPAPQQSPAVPNADAPAPVPAPTTPPAPAAPQATPDETLQQFVETLPPDADKSGLLQKAAECFPNALAYSFAESSQYTDGQEKKAITLTLIDQDGNRKEFTKTWEPQKPANAGTATMPPFSPTDAALVQNISDPLIENIIEQEKQLCILLQSIKDKETADAAAPKLQLLCQAIEAKRDVAFNRQLSPVTKKVLRKKYAKVGKAVFSKADSLISDIAAKKFYGSDALKNVAEPWLR